MYTIEALRSKYYDENLKYVEGVGALEVEFFNAKRFGGYFLQQIPEEFAALLTYLEERLAKPRWRYLEIGSASGGFIRCIYERLGFDEAVMIDDGRWQAEYQEGNIAEFSHRVKRFILDSHSQEAKSALMGERPFDVILIDGDHSHAGVLQDLDLVLPYANDQTYIVFHDIHATKEAPGVVSAFKELMDSGRLVQLADFHARVNNPLGIAVCRKARAE